MTKFKILWWLRLGATGEDGTDEMGALAQLHPSQSQSQWLVKQVVNGIVLFQELLWLVKQMG